MNDGWLARMQLIKGIEEIFCPLDHLLNGKRPLSDAHQVSEVMTRDKLHDEKLAISFGEIVCDFWKRRMAKIGEQLRFALKRTQVALADDQGLFDGNDAIEGLIDRLIYRPNPPFRAWLPISITTVTDRISCTLGRTANEA